MTVAPQGDSNDGYRWKSWERSKLWLRKAPLYENLLIEVSGNLEKWFHKTCRVGQTMSPTNHLRIGFCKICQLGKTLSPASYHGKGFCKTYIIGKAMTPPSHLRWGFCNTSKVDIWCLLHATSREGFNLVRLRTLLSNTYELRPLLWRKGFQF